MVRLKVCSLYEPYRGPKLFQFLMVRLKGKSIRQSSSASYVSIPYGSIKRVSGVRATAPECLVSIPYGSIKRWPSWPSLLSYFSVSIPYGSIKRESGKYIANASNAVSIPYGSIKSKCENGIEVELPVSIPYGSIKSGELSSEGDLPLCFNSLWFD